MLPTHAEANAFAAEMRRWLKIGKDKIEARRIGPDWSKADAEQYFIGRVLGVKRFVWGNDPATGKRRLYIRQSPREIERERLMKARAAGRLGSAIRAQRMAAASAGTDRKATAAFYRHVRNAVEISCYWCGEVVPPGRRHVDHVVPIARGGAHEAYNLCASCKGCNLRKRSKLPEEFCGQFEIVFRG